MFGKFLDFHNNSEWCKWLRGRKKIFLLKNWIAFESSDTLVRFIISSWFEQIFALFAVAYGQYEPAYQEGAGMEAGAYQPEAGAYEGGEGAAYGHDGAVSISLILWNVINAI